MEQTSSHFQDKFPFPRLLRATESVNLSFFEPPAETVARALLGSVLFYKNCAGTVVETEAYIGLDDLAAHASRGLTPRNRVLFGPPGYAYVYLIYGIHECLNVKADRDGVPGCVLIRALEPLCGIEEMYRRRKWNGPPKCLANGPGKLTQALGITRKLYGERMDEGDLRFRLWRERPSFDIQVTPRIGITKCADWPLRFLWKGHPCVSKGG